MYKGREAETMIIHVQPGIPKLKVLRLPSQFQADRLK